MKGFIIKSSTWGYQTHKVGLPEGCTISFEFSRWWGAIWCPSGYTNESEHWSWHGGDIHVGDEVEIEVIEITPEEVDAPSHVIREKECTISPTNENEDDSEIWKQKLYDYYQYKKILEDEGITVRTHKNEIQKPYLAINVHGGLMYFGRMHKNSVGTSLDTSRKEP